MLRLERLEDRSAPVALSYSLGNIADGALRGVTPAEVIAAVQQALVLWGAATGGEISYPYVGTARGDINFYHRDLSGTGWLAYTSGRDVAIADNVFFAISRDKTPNLLLILTHEVGHALGLGHDDVEPSVMQGTPFPVGVFGGLGTGFLYPADVAHVRSLYPGPRQSDVPGSLPANPFPGYLGAVTTLSAGGEVVALAGDAPNAHLKVFTAGGAERASFEAYPGYSGHASFSVTRETISTLAPEAGHVKVYDAETFALTASYLQ